MDIILQYAIWLVGIAAVIAYFALKNQRNRAAAESGEDMRHIREKVQSLFTDTDCQVVYAHHEETEHYGRTTKTTYYHYAVAFRGDTLWVFPMGVDKKTGEIQIGKPRTLTPDVLGRVVCSVDEKNGAVRSVDAQFFNKEGKSIVPFTVDAKNFHKNKFYPVNILQEDGTAQFAQFVAPLAQRIAGENTALEEKLKEDAKEANGTIGMIISLISVVVGFFVGPIGLIGSAIGLIIAIRGKMQGGKKNTGLIVCVVVTIILAVWSVIEMSFIFS